MTTHKSTFILFLIVAWATNHPSYGQIGDTLPLDDPNAMVKMVLSALKAIEFPTTGRGSLSMTTENCHPYLDGKELIADFVFKDQKSRTDIFESIDGGKGPRLMVRLESGKGHINVNERLFDIKSRTGEVTNIIEPLVYIERSQGHSDHKYDFHPSVFLKFNQLSLTKWLELMLEHPEIDVSAEVDDKGILHFRMSGHVVNSVTGQEYENEMQFSFDTERGLLPVFFKNIFKYPERTSSSTVNLQWAEYGSTWYVSRAEYRVQPKTNKHKVITIKKFSPNVDVAEEEFTLKSVGIKDGTEVVDKVAGMSYLYGASAALLEDLERPLGEAEFVRKIAEQQPALVQQMADANNQSEPADRSEVTVSKSDSTQTTVVARTETRPYGGKRIVISCLAVLIGVVAFVGYRHVVTR